MNIINLLSCLIFWTLSIVKTIQNKIYVNTVSNDNVLWNVTFCFVV